VKIDTTTRTPIIAGVPLKISDFDKNALEAAIQIKEKESQTTDISISAVAVGSDAVKDALREALAMGADDAYALIDKAFENSDTLGTARILAGAIKKIGYDIILCGEASIDGYSAQIGPRIAELLAIPQITYVCKLTYDGKKLIAERTLEDCMEVVEAEPPVLVTVTKEINEPRLPTLMQILGASNKPLTEWNASETGISENEVGAGASHISILQNIAPLVSRKGKIWSSEDLDTATEELAKALRKEGVVE
jgi:electron transfer flavoprotein beta subunit